MSNEDMIALQALYRKKIEGWNEADGQKFAEPYSEDADFIGFDGTHLSGRCEIAEFHQMLFDKFLKGSLLIGKIKSIKFPIPNVAIIVAISGTIEANQTGINPERNSIHTIVAINHKDSKQWYFTAFQNTRATYMGRPEKTAQLTQEIEQLRKSG
ncbi:hypothetical protein YTPLAS21_05770 [Candidatus Nitrosocosmicus sp.]|jgi:uncharacterized protein (TIGR02246 family)|uniref:SgcJ/EcaC family oxidoreductase n=1 Tax=Candidatus Nitrosocosmicus sp. FF01 TaxID=3397670 RepID=UPI002ACCE748|nr:hypothetical protein YTPLAS21_05770 [Candidatus Nitrosocosmicus sp.]